MNTFLELIQAVQSDATIGDESSLFPLDTVKNAIKRSYIKCAGLFRWPETEDALKTSSVANQDYYDYPDNWRPDSIWRLEVDGVQWGEPPDGSPLSFNDFRIWRANDDYANSTDKKWANQWRRYFIYPTPTTNGDHNICVWGQKVVEDISANDDVTIFSYSMPECNEAVVLEAVAILKMKGEQEKVGEMLSLQAKQILASAWKKIKDEQSKYEKNMPYFEVPDFFGRGATSRRRGNF